MPQIHPIPDELSEPYWAAANRGELVIQRCKSCRRYQQPPAVMCMSCSSDDIAFEPVSGKATVHSFTMVHDARYKAFQEIQPYPVAAVELAEQTMLLLLTNLPGADPASLRIGMPVEVTFEQVTPDQAIPQFRPTGGGPA